jgi:hypothetical protein
MSLVDPLGLDQRDVHIAQNYLNKEFPDLEHPPVVYTPDSSFAANNYGLYLDLIGRLGQNVPGPAIALPQSDIWRCLSEDDFKELIDTLYHETLHANDSLFGMFSQFMGDFYDKVPGSGGLGPHHLDITNKAHSFTKAHADEIHKLFTGTRTQCECSIESCYCSRAILCFGVGCVYCKVFLYRGHALQ